jgi:hypothetical protein
MAFGSNVVSPLSTLATIGSFCAIVVLATNRLRAHARSCKGVEQGSPKELAHHINALVERRWYHRQLNEFQAADAIMAQLRQLGVHVDDTATQCTWHFVSEATPLQNAAAAVHKTNRTLNPGRMRRRRAQKRQHHVRSKKVRAAEFGNWLMQRMQRLLSLQLLGKDGTASDSFHVWDVAGGVSQSLSCQVQGC